MKKYKSTYYSVCPNCNSTLDPNEKCVCEEFINSKPQDEIFDGNKLLLSETFIIGVDIAAGPHTSVVQVGRLQNGVVTIFKTLKGEEAESLYFKIAELS